MTKDAVLAILRSEQNYISGEKISSKLGISRAAVNTAVKSLRKAGYEILSTTNKGYLLKEVPNALTANELSVFLPGERMESVHCLDSVDSTNNYLREMAFSDCPDGQIVIANEQTNGRGRRGRNFVSPRDKGIYLSVLFRPDSFPSDMPAITAWTAVAVNNAIESVCHVRPGIKWVNDLVMNKQKLCGILTEMSIESESGQVQYVIIGIGLNVNEDTSDFPEELTQIATSLAMETGKTFCRAELAAEIIRQLDIMISSWPNAKETYLNAYRADDITVGKNVTVIQKSGEKSATATEITDSFSLRIHYKDGTDEILSGGEVSIRGIYGKQ